MCLPPLCYNTHKYQQLCACTLSAITHINIDSYVPAPSLL
jgi:hypothetical protein